MIDYELKQKVLKMDDDTSILALERKCSRLDYCRANRIDSLILSEANYLDVIRCKFDSELWNEAYKINHASYARTLRLRRKLAWMLSNFECSFLTFDFSDSTLALDSSYRRILICRTCNALDTYYIGNIDFGSDNLYYDRKGVVRKGTKREHYHVVVAKRVDTRLDASLSEYISKGYGGVYVEYCGSSAGDFSLLSRYVSKLSNHAVKETARRSALIYSRKHKIQEIDLPVLSGANSGKRPSFDDLRLCDEEAPYIQQSFLSSKKDVGR